MKKFLDLVADIFKVEVFASIVLVAAIIIVIFL